MEENTNKESPDLSGIEWMAKMLDSKFRIPGTSFSFGLDPIIGLIPFLGSGVTLILQGSLTLYMLKYGASRKVAIKMALNVLFDTILSSIPFLGQIGDFFFKANKKNVKLLKEHYFEGKHKGSGTGIILLLLLFLLALLALFCFGAYELIKWIIHLF